MVGVKGEGSWCWEIVQLPKVNHANDPKTANSEGSDYPKL